MNNNNPKPVNERLQELTNKAAELGLPFTSITFSRDVNAELLAFYGLHHTMFSGGNFPATFTFEVLYPTNDRVSFLHPDHYEKLAQGNGNCIIDRRSGTDVILYDSDPRYHELIKGQRLVPKR